MSKSLTILLFIPLWLALLVMLWKWFFHGTLKRPTPLPPPRKGLRSLDTTKR